MAIDGVRIQRITKEGLFYLDDAGEEQFIDFAAIRNPFEGSLAVEKHKAIQYIGEWTAEKQEFPLIGLLDFYLDLFTDPTIRIHFKFPSRHTLQILSQLEQVGWQVYFGSEESADGD